MLGLFQVYRFMRFEDEKFLGSGVRYGRLKAEIYCSRLGTAPLSNSWIILIIWLYIALNRTPNIDCYWAGAVPKF